KRWRDVFGRCGFLSQVLIHRLLITGPLSQVIHCGLYPQNCNDSARFIHSFLSDDKPMKLKLGVVMDPIAALNFSKDTTLVLLLAAAERGWELEYMEQDGLLLEQGVAKGVMRPLRVFDNPERWFELGEARTRDLSELDVILMRKDPPFDSEYVYSTYILEAAERRGVLVV